jgi:hypothetical protein
MVVSNVTVPSLTETSVAASSNGKGRRSVVPRGGTGEVDPEVLAAASLACEDSAAATSERAAGVAAAVATVG